MATNWWEIGKPVQDFEPVAQEKKEQNWWEIGKPVEETPKEEVAPVRPAAAPSPIGFGPLGLLTESIRSMKAGAEGQQTVNPILGATARGAELTGSALETTARFGQVAPQTLTATGPAISAIKSISPQLQQWADSFRNWGKEINYAPTTQLGELSDNPAKVVPFVLERVITSSPDMLAAYAALPAYIPTRANEILNERLKNDGRSLNEATIGDVAASAAAATVEGTLERFATRQLGATEGILRPTVLQAGTEAVEEVGAYAGETAGTKAGFDPTQAGLIAAEAAIVGGGLGGTIATGTELVRRNIESRVRDLEGAGTDIEQRELQKLRDQAFKDAQAITAPELAEATPVQYGDAYAQRVYNSVGQYIPVNAEFKVEEKMVDGAPQFVVTDKEGTQYGQTLQNKAQADAFALSLNNTTKSRAELIKQLEPLQTSLTDTLKGFGLNDVGLTLNDRIFTRRGEALTSEGLFDPVVRRVFLAVDAIDPQGNLDTNQRREALRGVLRHEVVHALRYLDLWKRSEWKNLESTVSKLKKPGTDKTYLQIAQENYGDQNKVVQVEEGVADLIRDVAGNLSKVAGKPRSLSERAINFFDKAKNAVTGAGFQTYEDIVQKFEQGDIGARQRGRIRTFRATEERQAEQGQLPERVQRLFTNPEERNRFRQEVVQETENRVPAASQPALNNLRLNAVRESRSTIDPVPPKIRVDEQEVPTRDSEGRLIYSGYEGPEVFGIQTRPTQEGLQNFWRWFGSSKVKDKQGRPQLFYHGTAADITEFRPKQAGSVFVTRSPQFAEEFSFYSDNYMVSNFPDFMSDQQVLDALDETLASPNAFAPKLYDEMYDARRQAALDVQNGKSIRPYALKKFKSIAAEGRSSRYLNAIQKRLPSSANLMPVYVKADKPWDYDSKNDVSSVVKRARDNGADITPSMIEEISQGNWQTIEGSEGNAPILDAIRELGYDSMYVEEQGEKNLAVFNPGQIKSAVGNTGDFSPITPSIRESRKPVYNIINSRTGEVVGQANTIGGARRSVDRRDNQYGASVHTIQTVDPERDIAARNVARERLGLPPIERESRVRNPQIDTPQFQRFIEDTKVVDENGDPLIMYHGAKEDIEDGIFRMEKGMLGTGAYFTRNPQEADFYTSNAVWRTDGNIVPSYVSIKNPYITRNKFDPEAAKAKDKGHDGVILLDPNGQIEWAVPFSPNQIKSAVGNIGAFDITRPSIREARKFPAKATQQDVAMAQEYLNRTGELPYLSEGQLEPVVPVARQSIKKPYEAKDLAKGRENDPISGLPLNKDGTVTLYFPATNEVARRTIQDKRLRGATPESNRIYLTNESSGPKVMENPGNIDQPMDGANVMIHVDPSLIHFDQEFPDGRKDFFVQLAEGKSYADKMKQTRLFTLDAPRTRALSKDTKLVDIERSVTNSINGYLSLNAADRRARLKQAREVLKREHNVGTLMGENGKLQKTRLGDYGLTYDGKSVASMGLGLASAQRINEQNLSTCPLSAMCEGLCLGETSGQNLLYGGEGQFKSGPRLSQYLKTEALVQHPEDFAVVLYEEIAKFEKWANSEKGLEQVENEAGEKVMQPKQVYQPAIRLNVTSDFRPQTFASIIEAFPNVMFYDYTKLPTRSIAPNHHLTYSSTGASQVVDGEVIVNPGSNWDKMVQRLNEGLNVAMAFTSRKDMPDFIIDEKTGQKFQVWNGDNYDARFLDPKREDGIGMVVGLTNKDKTTKPEDAAKKWKGFFLDYDRARDGDTLIIRDQGKLKLGIVPAAREARPTRAGPTQPGPATDRDNTSAADVLNMGEPIDSIGVPTGPQITDTMPDGTVNTSGYELDEEFIVPRARESRVPPTGANNISGARLQPLMKRLIRGVEFIQSAPDKLRGGVGLGDVAKRIEDYYDGYAAKLGLVNDIIRDAFNQIPRRNRESALNTFEQYIRARENKRTAEAQQIFASASPADRQLISAWDQISRETGRINLSVTTPDGDPMKVWDSKVGAWRPIRAVPQFFPRTLRKDVMEVMKNPDLDPALWDSLLDELVNSGRAQNRQEAEDYLIKEWFSDEIKQDYFAGVEKARTDPLPEIFYDYSWDAATRYLRKWARRTSQIENFGQELGQFKKDWFGTNIPKVRDQETQNYLNAIRERIYEIESFDTLTNIANWANSLATATQLGNPISASLNLLGGTITNVQEFGIRQIAKSYLDLVLDWKNVQKEGTTLGILNKDFMNILSDHVEMDADKYFSKEQKVSQALAKFANATLTYGGFNGAENIVRASAMLAARSWLNDSLKAVNTNPNSKKAKKFYEWINRENLDANALILENGAGPETEKYMRRAVNVPQGSYQIDMTPVFIDTPAGRFLLKYQKFGTQINRFFYRHFLKPFMDEPTPANFLRVAGFLGSAIIGGGAILALREAFGYGDPGPDDEEIKKALEKKDSERAWGLIFSRAWQNISAAGSLGFFANYAQLAKDWQDQLRVKNPLDPPGLASVETVLDIFNRLRDQGKLTARDLDEIAENALSFYRANKRIGLAALDAVGADYREVKRFSAQKEIREVREYGRRYSEEMEIEFKQRTAPGSPIRTPMTPVNKAIADALAQGDAGRARLLFRKALAGLPYEEREKVTSSVNAAVRNRQPIQIGGNAPNQQERTEFLRWARQNLPAEKYQLIIRTDRRYRISAQRAGLGFSE